MISLFLLAGAAAAPFAFQHLWAKTWFKVAWWLLVLGLIGNWMRANGLFN